MFLGLDFSVPVLAGAGAGVFAVDYARRFVRIRRAHRSHQLRRDRAAGRVAMVDFSICRRLAGWSTSCWSPNRRSGCAASNLSNYAEERHRSVSAAASPSAQASRRGSRESRELYRGVAEPATRVNAVLVELEGLLPIRDRIVATNEQPVGAVHGAATEHEREMSHRFGDGILPRLMPDEASLRCAVRTAAMESLRDCSLLWLRGSFSVTRLDDQAVLEGLLDANNTWTEASPSRFAARLRSSA